VTIELSLKYTLEFQENCVYFSPTDTF